MSKKKTKTYIRKQKLHKLNAIVIKLKEGRQTLKRDNQNLIAIDETTLNIFQDSIKTILDKKRVFKKTYNKAMRFLDSHTFEGKKTSGISRTRLNKLSVSDILDLPFQQNDLDAKMSFIHKFADIYISFKENIELDKDGLVQLAQLDSNFAGYIKYWKEFKQTFKYEKAEDGSWNRKYFGEKKPTFGGYKRYLGLIKLLTGNELTEGSEERRQQIIEKFGSDYLLKILKYNKIISGISKMYIDMKNDEKLLISLDKDLSLSIRKYNRYNKKRLDTIYTINKTKDLQKNYKSLFDKKSIRRMKYMKNVSEPLHNKRFNDLVSLVTEYEHVYKQHEKSKNIFEKKAKEHNVAVDKKTKEISFISSKLKK